MDRIYFGHEITICHMNRDEMNDCSKENIHSLIVVTLLFYGELNRYIMMRGRQFSPKLQRIDRTVFCILVHPNMLKKCNSSLSCYVLFGILKLDI